MSYQDMKIDYIELPARDMAGTRQFFEAVFGWQFTDYGPDYMAFNRQTVEGGFYRAQSASDSDTGAALVIFYARDLIQARALITSHGGAIKQDIFAFPGGQRFHFTCPSGNEFAIWSDQPEHVSAVDTP